MGEHPQPQNGRTDGITKSVTAHRRRSQVQRLDTHEGFLCHDNLAILVVSEKAREVAVGIKTWPTDGRTGAAS
jgi:hypothetical protein